MPTPLDDLVARVRLDTSELEGGTSKAAALGGAIGAAFGGLAVAGIGAAINGIKELVGGSVSAFSELEDSTAAAGVVFGDSMGIIIEQSKNAGRQLGLSEQQVINAANTFGTYGKAAGLTGDELAGFSTELTTLAGDMASFKGTSTEQAIEAVGAALRGETEPIRAYGVLLDDATLKAEAMALGISNGTAPLTAQQKVLAAQSAILKQTTDAQGDFARSSDSTANVAATLAAETENLQAKFGTLLAPAFTAARQAGIGLIGGLSGVLDGVIPKVQAFYDRTSTAITGLKALFSSGDVTGDLTSSLGIEEDSAVIDYLLRIRDTYSGLKALFSSGDVTGSLTSGLGIEEDSAVIDFLLSLRDTAVAVGQAIGPALSSIGGAASTAFSGVLQGLAPIGEAFVALGPTLASIIPSILEVASAFNPVGLIVKSLLPVLPQLAATFGSLISTMLAAVGPLIPIVVQLASLLVGQLSVAFQALIPALLPLVTTLGGVFASVLQMVVPIIGQLAGILAQLLPPILGLIGPIVTLLSAALTPIIGIVGTLITAILPPLLDLFVAIIGPVAELVGVLATALAPIITLVAGIIGSVLAPILSTLIGWLGNLIGWVLRLVGPVLGGLVSILSNVIGWIARVVGAIASWLSSLGGVSGAIDKMKSAVSIGVQAVLGFFSDLPGKIGNAIGSLASSLYNVGRDMIQGLINGVKNMAGSAVAAVKDVGSSILGGIKGVLGINSPSKEFRKIGEWTGEGFALGIEGSTAQVKAAAEDMVGALDVPIPTPSLPTYGGTNVNRGGYGVGGGPTTAVAVRVFIGDRELTDIVRVETRETLADEASAILTGATSA